MFFISLKRSNCMFVLSLLLFVCYELAYIRMYSKSYCTTPASASALALAKSSSFTLSVPCDGQGTVRRVILYADSSRFFCCYFRCLVVFIGDRTEKSLDIGDTCI